MINYIKFRTNAHGWMFSIALILFLMNSANAEITSSRISKSKLQEFYEEQDLILDYVVSTDKNKKISISTVVSGDDFHIVVNEEEKKQLIDSLTQSFGVDSAISRLIVDDLLSGVSSSRACVGYRSECGIIPERYDFVYIPDQARVVIHVDSKYLRNVKVSDDKYIKRDVLNSAFISSHTMNLSVLDRDSSYDSKISYQNKSYLGISDFGYLYSEFMVNSEGDYSIPDFSLNRVYENNRISLGYKYSNTAWNDSSYLGDFGISGFMLQLGTDDSMLKESGIDQRIYFNVSKGGRLEVTDDLGRYLISKNIDIGQHYISYSELPKGNYNITIRVYDGDMDIYNERSSVYNYQATRSGSFNYMISGGYYDPHWITNKHYATYYDDIEKYESAFLDGRFSYRLMDNVVIGSGSLVTDNDYVLYSGLDLGFNRQFRTSFIVNSYNSDDFSYRLNAYSKNLSLSYYHYKIDDYDNLSFYNMINVSPGERDNLSFNFNYSFYNPFSYVGSITHSRFSNNRYNYEYSYDNTTIKNSLYFLNLPLRSKLGVQYDTIFENNKKTQHGFYVSLSIPLSNDNSHVYTHSMAGSFDNNRVTRHQDSLSSNLISAKKINLSSRVGSSYEQKNSDNNTYDLSFSGSYYDDYQNVNGYGYMNSKGSNSLSAQYNTNSILTSDNLHFTAKRSSTYFINKNTSKFDDKNSFLAVVDSKKNGSIDKTYAVNGGVGTYPLSEYKEYEFFLDTDASDFYNIGDERVSASSFPGTVIGLKTGLGEVKSVISMFSDINGLPIEDVECVGFGCVSVIDISDGVYQIRLKPEYDYKIISRKNQCVIPSLVNVKNLNLGNNFCMPPFYENEDGFQISRDDKGFIYYYLGKFSKNKTLARYIDDIKSNTGVELIVKNVDDFEFLFIKTNRDLSVRQRSNISELMTYALTNDDFTPYASIGH